MNVPATARETAPGYPLRVAAIDVGSNAIRFLAAEFSEPSRWTRLDHVRAAVRLGREAFTRGRLEERSVAAALEAMADFRRRMDALEITRYGAVATSAVRDAANGPAFADRVRDEAGIRLEVISGVEEARLVWLAVRERVPLGGREWVLVDLGGGSLEVSLVDARGVRWSESYPLGTVRLLEEVGAAAARDAASLRRVLEEHPALRAARAAAGGVDGAGLIATGGNIEALAGLADAPHDAAGVRSLALAELRATMQRLSGRAPAKLMRRFGLRADRADVILPAAAIYELVAESVGARELVVADAGVKEGVLLEVANRGRGVPLQARSR